MAKRPEIYEQLVKDGLNGGIVLEPGAGRQALERIDNLYSKVSDARSDLMRHKLATAYRVTIFGSKFLTPKSPDYVFARDLSRKIVEATGADVITGGGPGVMTAALEGAALAGKPEAAIGLLQTPEGGTVTAPANDILTVLNSTQQENDLMNRPRRYGVNVVLPWEQKLNEHVTHQIVHDDIMSRIQQMVDLTHGVYSAIGGIGTILELLTFIQLKQVNHLEKGFPLGVHEDWRPVLDAVDHALYHERVQRGEEPLIQEGDIKVFYSSDIPEIVDVFVDSNREWKRTIGNNVRWSNRSDTINP